MEEFKNMDKLKDDLFEAIETICKDYESKHEPKFKAGQWYIREYKHTETEDKMFRISRIEGRYFYYDCSNISAGSNWIAKDSPFYNESRPATPAEIESYLRKICNEKYIGKKVCSIYNITGTVKGQIYKYLFDSDEFIYDNGLTVYKQGKFASIIPDKKKLPKTKEEYKVFLDDFWHALPEDDKIDGLVSDDFLDQYEIE